MDNSHVIQMVNLITLTPDIVAVLLDGTLPDNITLLELAADSPLLCVWGDRFSLVSGSIAIGAFD